MTSFLSSPNLWLLYFIVHQGGKRERERELKKKKGQKQQMNPQMPHQEVRWEGIKKSSLNCSRNSARPRRSNGPDNQKRKHSRYKKDRIEPPMVKLKLNVSHDISNYAAEWWAHPSRLKSHEASEQMERRKIRWIRHQFQLHDRHYFRKREEKYTISSTQKYQSKRRITNIHTDTLQAGSSALGVLSRENRCPLLAILKRTKTVVDQIAHVVSPCSFSQKAKKKKKKKEGSNAKLCCVQIDWWTKGLSHSRNQGENIKSGQLFHIFLPSKYPHSNIEERKHS